MEVLKSSRRARLVILATFVLLFVSFSKQSAQANWGSLSPDEITGTPPTITMLDIDGPQQHYPIIGVELGGISLQRSQDQAFPMVFTDGLSGPVEVIATSEIVSPDSAGGTRFALNLFNLSDRVGGLDMEATFFEVSDELGDAVVDITGFNTTNVIPVFFNAIPASPEAVETFSFKSAIESIEWNLGYRPVAGLRLIAGLRWFDLKEQFDRVAAQSNLGFFSETDNDLFGVQIGAEATIWTNGTFRVYGSGKWAFLENEVRGESILANADIGFRDEVDSTLFDLEIGVSAAISGCASLQIAYQGLFLQDATAILPQSNSLNVFGSNDQTPIYSDIDWNGVHFGITFVW